MDSSDRHRLQDCKAELDKLLVEERLTGASLLIVANKQDLFGALKPSEIAQVLDIERISKSRHCAIYSCSAFKQETVRDAINWIIYDIGNRIYTLR